MKKTLALLLAVLMMVSVIPFAAAAEHEHKDNNCNGICDEAGCKEATTAHDHFDTNGNGTCDYTGCKETVAASQPEEEPKEEPKEEATHTHKDNNGNGICDEAGCKEATTNHDHTDANENGVCDYTGCKVEVIAPSKPSTKPNTGYNYSKNYHWVEINGVILTGTKEAHTFNRTNGKCKYCGYYNKNYDNDYKYGYGDYRVYVSDSGKGDTDVSTYYADAGDRVYVYTDPDFGYLLVDIEVETKNGREIKVTKSSNGKYSFKMPSSNVYVQVAYSNGDKDISYGCDYYGSYTDVDSNAWYASAVKYVTNYEIMEGKSYNKFAPNSNMTRAALAEALYAIAGAKASGTENFSDVDRYDDFYEAVVWCAKKDIIEGWNGKFSPNGDITREDFAVMLYRFAKVERMSTKASEDLDQFTDADNVSDYAVEALEWAVAEGLINGMGDGTLAPQGTTTRAQAAAILMRLCKNVK